MREVLIHYFSGTGNSLLAAKQLGDELQKYDYQGVYHSIENGIPGNIDKYELHIFFFPVYATSVPHIVRKYIHNLPEGRGVSAAVISTNGRISTRFRDGHQGWALYQARLCLRLKNYQVFLSETLDFPHNVTIVGPPRLEKYNQQIIEQASVKLPDLARKIAERQRHHRRILWPNILWSLPLGYLFGWFGRRAIGKLFGTDSGCNRCGVCVKQCPARAIRNQSGQIKWGWNCEGCLRCINHCPKRAIQLSALRLAVMLGTIFFNPLFLLHNRIPAAFFQMLGRPGSVIFDVVLYTVSYIIFFVLFDWLVYRISRVPLLQNLTGWGHTKLFGRYLAKPFESRFLHKG